MREVRGVPLLVGLAGAPGCLLAAVDVLLCEVPRVQLPLLPQTGLLLPLPSHLSLQHPGTAGCVCTQGGQSHSALEIQTKRKENKDQKSWWLRMRRIKQGWLMAILSYILHLRNILTLLK